jgi:AcrR family transcriptional regulator
MDSAPGLRERKKQRTRDHIVAAAFRLFAERGYAETTLADIAAAADIAPRTFFAYFPSKEALLFCDAERDLRSLQEALDARPEGATAIERTREWIAGRLEHWASDPDAEVRKRLVREVEALAAQERYVMGRFEAVLRRGVARDLGEQPEALRPTLVAAAAIAALGSLEEIHGAEHTDGIEPATAAQQLAVLDEALVFLEGGIAALQGHEAPERLAAATDGH